MKSSGVQITFDPGNTEAKAYIDRFYGRDNEIEKLQSQAREEVEEQIKKMGQHIREYALGYKYILESVVSFHEKLKKSEVVTLELVSDLCQIIKRHESTLSELKKVRCEF